MPLTIQASIEIIQLLEKLFKDWESWDQNRDFYIHTLLPDLMSHPNNGTSQEKAILREIKKIATQEEWQNLIAIADQMHELQQRILEVSKILDQFFEKNDFVVAEAYVSKNPEPAIRSLYEQKKRIAISKNMKQIRLSLNQFDFLGADQEFSIIRHHITENETWEYQSLVKSQQHALIQETMSKIEATCQHYNFTAVEPLYNKISAWVSRDVIEPIIQEAKRRQLEEEKQRFVASMLAGIQSLLAEYKYLLADEKYSLIKDDYPWDSYQQLVQTYHRLQDREKLLSVINSNLESHRFSASDQLFLSSDLFSIEEYLQVKSPYIQEYVQINYSKTINLEKAIALANPSRNLLLSARAGSGKTTVLACKTSLLVDTENIHPDHILVMAFNNYAAKEIGSRIRSDFKQKSFENARTFHSLAMQLVQPQEEILYDEIDDISSKKMTIFIQQLLKKEIHNPVFLEKMYAFFRKETREIERAGYLLAEEEYFDFRRNLLQVTLGGEKVKSVGEKYIADYLFEHDISYGYEKVWLWGSQIYRPDFSLYEQQKDIVIEHWGIDEFDLQKQAPPEWTESWDEYYSEMQAKRQFLKAKSTVLVETSIRDLRNGREAFEVILEKRFADAGIVQRKLTTTELHQRIKDRDYTITRMAELFAQFIQKAKKQILKGKDVQILLQSYQPKDEREGVFVDLACRVYLEYEQALARENKIDYDDLMMRAIEKIHLTQGECSIWLGKPKSRPVKMNDLNWILIDEYQDFSRLFFELIKAIRKYNPEVRIFCVGDDWQAINGFAGSDLQYFHTFVSWVPGSSIAYLSTNFRSQAEIVRNGNELMHGKGKPAEALPEKPGGNIMIEWMDDCWLELRSDETKGSMKNDHERFLITSATSNGNGKKYNHIIASKYLKRCYEIITDSENIGKKVAILNRTGRIDGIRLTDFKSRLKSCLTIDDLKKIGDPDHKIDIQTVHKYKGLEADLVIILNVTNGSFPLLHPDNLLFEIFGKTVSDAYNEEQRLFYVALTRAKNKVYILTEKHRESVFLDSLRAYQSVHPQRKNYSANLSFEESINDKDLEEIPF